MTVFGIKIGLKLLAITAAAILVILAFTLGPAACNRIGGLETQVKVDSGQHGALVNSVHDATGTISNVSADEANGVRIGRTNEEEIRNAKGADMRVDPGANAAGLRALCRRSSHAHDPACRVQQPHP